MQGTSHFQEVDRLPLHPVLAHSHTLLLTHSPWRADISSDWWEGFLIYRRVSLIRQVMWILDDFKNICKEGSFLSPFSNSHPVSSQTRFLPYLNIPLQLHSRLRCSPNADSAEYIDHGALLSRSLLSPTCRWGSHNSESLIKATNDRNHWRILTQGSGKVRHFRVILCRLSQLFLKFSLDSINLLLSCVFFFTCMKRPFSWNRALSILLGKKQKYTS